MPLLHRQVVALLADHQDAVVSHHPRERFAVAQRRCERCECVLARDNLQAYCSPCQRRLDGVPDNLSLYLPVRPQR